VKGTDPGQQKRPDEIEARLKLQSTLRRRFAVGLGMIIFSILLGLGGWAVVIGITLVVITAVLTTLARYLLVFMRGCLKSPANAKFTERGIGFIPALRKLK